MKTKLSKPFKKEMTIPLKENRSIQGILNIPPGANLIVVFAHGSGSGRFSKRNQFVMEHLVKNGIGALLLDLLTNEEEAIDNQTGELRFNIPFLAQRLVEVTHWLNQYQETHGLHVAYFGASTGAAAALMAASKQGSKIKAIVSRGGRPDLAAQALNKVSAPTLLIVGGNDFGVIELNQQAYELLPEPKKLEIIPGATHLFEEPGALEQVSLLAAAWFKHFSES